MRWKIRKIVVVFVVFAIFSLCLYSGRPSYRCGWSHLRLASGEECPQLLNCRDLAEMHIVASIGEGAVKSVFLAKSKFHYIAVSQLKEASLEEDFAHNLRMLQTLAGSKHVTQLLGHCNSTHIFTRYYPYGNLINLAYILDRFDHQPATCLKICLSYVQVIDFLHNSPAGTRVMCDSNDLGKLLSQFLLTESLEVLVNDLDALPVVVNGKKVICGHRELKGNFVAPEQLWTSSDAYDEEKMVPYDEKIDIWKIPDVCSWIVSLCLLSDLVLERLQPIHDKCKELRPSDRPTAKDIVQVYTEVLRDFIHS